jgi:hypothetical protein
MEDKKVAEMEDKEFLSLLSSTTEEGGVAVTAAFIE